MPSEIHASDFKRASGAVETSAGTYEWPALLRRCDRLDPSYKH